MEWMILLLWASSLAIPGDGERFVRNVFLGTGEPGYPQWRKLRNLI
jgi:hypothetical protein